MGKKGMAIALSALIGATSVPISGVSAEGSEANNSEKPIVQSDKKPNKLTKGKIVAALGVGAAFLTTAGYCLIRPTSSQGSTATESPAAKPLDQMSKADTESPAAKPLGQMSKAELLKALPKLWYDFYLACSKAYNAARANAIALSDRAAVRARVTAIDLAAKVAAERVIDADAANAADRAAVRAAVIDAAAREAYAETFAETFPEYWKEGKSLYNEIRNKSRSEILNLATFLEEKTAELNKIASECSV